MKNVGTQRRIHFYSLLAANLVIMAREYFEIEKNYR